MTGTADLDRRQDLGSNEFRSTRRAPVWRPGFRGCAFINAAAEYPDPDHPVHQAVIAHREWFRTAITGLFVTSGSPSPRTAAGTT